MVFVASSCKKGENDPFLSFRSRDGRITAVWKLVGIEGTTKNTSVSGSTTSITTTTQAYSGGTLTTTTTSSSGTTSNTSKFDFEMTLEKDGHYASKTNNYNTSGTLTSAYEAEGNWVWLTDGKNKSSVTITDLSGSVASGTFDVDQLKSKELKLKKHQRIRQASGSNSFEQDATTTYTYEKQ